MTPSLFDLPLRIGDASALAAVLIDCAKAEPKPITPEIRTRAAARLSGIRFESLQPLTPSLERDPLHPSALYICVDGVNGQPLLLRVAPASTPSSGLFPKAILIGRTQLGPVEVVLNAVPFGPGERDRIRSFSEHVNRAFLPKAFLPKPFGAAPVIRIEGSSPAESLPAVFAELRTTLRGTGRNQAAFAATEGQNRTDFYFALVWSAVRCGWREGYALESPPRL